MNYLIGAAFGQMVIILLAFASATFGVRVNLPIMMIGGLFGSFLSYLLRTYR